MGSTHYRGRRNAAIAAPEPTQNNPKPLDPAPPDTHASTSNRGKKTVVQEINSANSSNAALAKAQSTLCCDEKNVRLSSVTYESQPGEVGTTVVTLEEIPEEVSDYRRASSVHLSPLPAVDEVLPGLLRPSYFRIAYFFERFTSVVLAEYLWPSTGFSSYGRIPRNVGRTRLLRSLYGQRPTLFLLVVAVDDAVRDLWVLDHALTTLNSESIRFTGLGGWITLEDINVETRKLREESKKFPGSQVVVILTGHGDEYNKMSLPMSKSVDATYLFELLLEPHGARSAVSATILFDICRSGGDPSPEPPEGISLLWTCSLGEVAGAYRLPHGPDSCFLTALMMASREGPNRIHEPLQGVQIQLNRVTKYLQELDSMKHAQGGCRWCSSGRRCYKPTPQNVDSSHVQHVDGLLMLMQSLSGTEVVDGVYQWFMENYVFCVANSIPAPRGSWDWLWSRLWRIDQEGEGSKPESLPGETTVAGSDYEFVPLPEVNASRHGRGANEPAHAGQVPRM